MSSFQDDQNGNDLTQPLNALEVQNLTSVNLFVEDIELELAGLLSGLKMELKNMGKNAYLATDEGKMASTYLDFWLRSIEADHQGSTELTLSELLLFIAGRQAEMNMKIMGKVN